MPDRIPRLNQLLKREVGQIILKEGDFPPNLLVTVTRVETSSTLQEARVWISVIPDNKADWVLKILKKQVYEIQQLVNKRLRIRPVPKIFFSRDFKTAEAGRIEELLEEVKEDKEP